MRKTASLIVSSLRAHRRYALFAFAIAVLGLSFWAYQQITPHTYHVKITDDGFSPAEITIRDGDAIEFTNASSRDAWPASDPHPTHTDLAGFDPKQAVGPGKSWTFVFTETGSWRYHDHLNVTSRGEVFVLRRSGAMPSTAVSGYCDGKCFDELIRKTVKDKGIDAAYALFQESYESGQLPRGCHWTAHQIGEAAYQLYKDGKDFPISSATSFCGYGFYHGFMESLLREDPNPQVALQFCAKVEKQLGSMGLQNCYHGIGHGYTEDPPDPAFIGSFQKMITPGTKMCEYLFGSSFRNLNLCLTGVFTVPVGFAADGKYGLSMDPKDPFKVCRTQPFKYQKACYGEFAAKLDSVINWDLKRLKPYIDSIQNDKEKRLVTWVVPSVMMAKDVMASDFSSYINDCRATFDGRLRNICWGGTILGFFQHGEPEKQYEKLIPFCEERAWQNDEERAFCWGEIFRQMRQNYTLDKVKGLCPRIPEKFRSLCLDEDKKHISPYDDPSFETP